MVRKLRERVSHADRARDLGGQARWRRVGAMTALADLAVAETYRSVASELAAVHACRATRPPACPRKC